MTKQKIQTPNAPIAVGPYSPAVVTTGVGDFIFTSGQIPLDSSGKMVEGSVEAQTDQIMANLKAVLEAAGATFSDVVKTTIYVTDMADFSQLNAAYGKHFQEPYPARETVCVKALPLGARLEISMVAVKKRE